MDLVAFMSVKSRRNQNKIRLELKQARENFFYKFRPPVFRWRPAWVYRHVKDATRVHIFIFGSCVLFRSACAWVETLTFLLKVVKKMYGGKQNILAIVFVKPRFVKLCGYFRCCKWRNTSFDGKRFGLNHCFYYLLGAVTVVNIKIYNRDSLYLVSILRL